MSKLLESGDLQKHILETLQPAYSRRYWSMINAIKTHLHPLGVLIPTNTYDSAVGGYFIWILLPSPLRAIDVATRSKRDQALTVMPGPNFAVWGDEDVVSLDGNLRLTFSWEDEAKLAEGIERLAVVIQAMQSDKTG